MHRLGQGEKQLHLSPLDQSKLALPARQPTHTMSCMLNAPADQNFQGQPIFSENKVLGDQQFPVADREPVTRTLVATVGSV